MIMAGSFMKGFFQHIWNLLILREKNVDQSLKNMSTPFAWALCSAIIIYGERLYNEGKM